MLHDWELSDLRGDVQGVMPDRCDVYRRAAASDQYGGGGGYGDPHATEVPVQVEPVAVSAFSETIYGAGRETDTTSFELAFPHGTDVRAGDLIVITTLGDIQITVRQVEDPESWNVLVAAQGTLAQ